MNPFSALTSKIFAGTSVALLIAIAALLIYKNGQISSLQHELDTDSKTIAVLRQNNETLKQNNVSLQFSLEESNRAIQATADAANRAAAAGDAALAAAKQVGASRQTVIERIKKMPTATCADAEAILRAGGQ